MRPFKSLSAAKTATRLASKPAPGTVVVDVRQAARRLLIEYILNMAVTALAQGDVEPLYDQYMQDPRLSDEDRDELARAYLLLQMAPLRPRADEDAPAAEPAV